MKATTKVLAIASVTGVVLAGNIVSPAFAWHPKGVIKKYVQNQTAGGPLADANDAATAVSAKTGDTLKYVIEIRNDGQADAKGWNDMHFTVMTDTLPKGVALISDPTKTKITENIGVIKAGQKVTKEYMVKVTSDKDKDLIENKACFEADSEVKDNKQSGCDVADVKVSVPPKQEPPKQEPPVSQPPKEEPKPTTPAPAELPKTGASAVAAPAIAGVAAVLGYAGNMLRLKRKSNR